MAKVFWFKLLKEEASLEFDEGERLCFYSIEWRVHKLISRRELSIAVPSSLVSDIPHLREKTLKIGMVGRAAAVFRVEEIILYFDAPGINQNREIDLINVILSYMETPQYLRKRLFKIRHELRYAGVLPPLRTPHHPLQNRAKDLVDREYREGVVVSHTKEGLLVDVGVERHILIRNKKMPINTRITVKMRRCGELLEAEIAKRSEIEEYWGYRTTRENLTLGELLKKRVFDLIIATSKYGRPFLESSKDLIDHWETSRKILVAFGAPTKGLYELLEQENLDLDNVADFVVNTFPSQGVETVRTEEAIFTTLGILNLMVAKG